jgi:transposase
MKRKQYSRVVKWRASDAAHLSRALKRTREAKVYQRILALRLIAAGWSVSGAARFIHRSRQAVHHWLKRFGRRHRIADLQAAPRPGRPRQAPVLTEARILRELHRNPLDLGYAALTWTVPLLTWHLRRRYQCQISPWTLRRRMKQIGLEWKRPRYVYVERDLHRAQKKVGHPPAAALAATGHGVAGRG